MWWSNERALLNTHPQLFLGGKDHHWGAVGDFIQGQTGVSFHVGLSPGAVGVVGAPALSLASGAVPQERSSRLSIPKQSVFPARKAHPGASAALPTVPHFGRVYWNDAQSYSTTQRLLLQEGF